MQNTGLRFHVNILLCILGSKEICEENQDALEVLIQSSDEEGKLNENEDSQKGIGIKEKITRKRTKKVRFKIIVNIILATCKCNKG